MDWDLQSHIVKLVANKCLERPRSLRSFMSSGGCLLHRPSDPDWNMGSPLPLSEAASLLAPEQLAQLKSGCGGLQTLLRNHGHVFVVSQGTVRLRCHARDEFSVGRRSKRKKKTDDGLYLSIKKKPCWFFDHHPQGCSVSAETCTWAHGKDDIAE